MRTIKKQIFLLLSAATCLSSNAAEQFVLGSALEGAQKLTSEELNSVMRPGVQVETYSPGTGAVRHWENSPNGKFVASRQGGERKANSSGSGEWKLSENGRLYCVDIDWRTNKNAPDKPESWCRALYRYENSLYMAPDNLKPHLDQQFSVVRFK